MSWWHIIKFHPDLRRLAGDEKIKVIQLGDEESMKELWDASNPDMPHTLRSGNKWIYPIDDWYGTIVNYDENKKEYPNGKKRLVSVTGNAIREGKNGKSFAFVGGTKTHPSYRKQGLMSDLRDKNIQAIGTRPKLAGYTKMGKGAFSEDKKPTSHEVIPDDVIEFMNERIDNLPNVVDWGIIEYDATNKSEMWEYIE